MQSIIQPEKYCYICGSRMNLELHHVLFGSANRKLADEDGLTVWLCPLCHRGTYGVHGREGHGLDLDLKKIAEAKWLRMTGKTKADWIKRYGKNYLD